MQGRTSLCLAKSTPLADTCPLPCKREGSRLFLQQQHQHAGAVLREALPHDHQSCSLGHTQAVLINQGWECKDAKGKAVVARLAKVPMAQLCPTGFIFIWVDKTLVGQLLPLERCLHHHTFACSEFVSGNHLPLFKGFSRCRFCLRLCHHCPASADSRDCISDGQVGVLLC